MAKNAKKITLKGSSGYCSVGYAFTDRLAAAPSSISYELKPTFPSESRLSGKWSYRTESPEFADLFWDLERAALRLLRMEEEPFVCDVGEISITVLYEDGTKEGRRFPAIGKLFGGVSAIVSGMLPPCERMPASLDFK